MRALHRPDPYRATVPGVGVVSRGLGSVTGGGSSVGDYLCLDAAGIGIGPTEPQHGQVWAGLPRDSHRVGTGGVSEHVRVLGQAPLQCVGQRAGRERGDLHLRPQGGRDPLDVQTISSSPAAGGDDHHRSSPLRIGDPAGQGRHVQLREHLTNTRTGRRGVVPMAAHHSPSGDGSASPRAALHDPSPRAPHRLLGPARDGSGEDTGVREALVAELIHATTPSPVQTMVPKSVAGVYVSAGFTELPEKTTKNFTHLIRRP